MCYQAINDNIGVISAMPNQINIIASIHHRSVGALSSEQNP